MNISEFSHASVLLNECIDSLAIDPDLTYVDCTTGGGGHSYEIAARLGEKGRLICFDRDEAAIAAAKARLSPFLNKITFVHRNFGELGDVLDELKVENLGGVLADLGCSSYQFDTPERGFSYQHDAPLDMRMDTSAPKTAYTVVNTYSEDELKQIIFDYGEERFAPRIAAKIAQARALSPIETTGELVDIIKSAIPKAARENGPHPAKRTFQAIRIEVNAELDAISPMIKDACRRMLPGGRIALISFHSLEDRIVKQTFASLSSGCTCPRDFPVCVCGKRPQVEILTKKPILPSEHELIVNPRSRSAKLRVCAKI
ncbi:MAG: 16S rRNA (cytosine(1402)-N(4))-methyltransferase RsmH [Clostridia bacterium]|nr:16S rRNA (cytosine(1402)-N(4))-methyltransferase RsmH [Clostridia bacterium]